jgi:hypothetical protein
MSMRIGYARAMEKEPHIPSQEQELPEPGSKAHWREIKRGFVLISNYRKVLASAEKALMYSAGGYDMEGNPYGIQENLAPWEAVDTAADALHASKTAVRILQVHKFTIEPVSPTGGTIIRNAEGSPVTSRDIPVFIRSQGRE